MKSVSPNSSPAKARSRQQQGSSVADASYESHFDNQAVFEFSTVINSSLDQDFIHSHILRTLMGKLMSARGMVLQADPESNKSYVIEKVKGFEAGIQGTRIVIPRMPRVLAMLGHSSASRISFSRNPTIVFPSSITNTGNDPAGLNRFTSSYTFSISLGGSLST